MWRSRIPVYDDGIRWEPDEWERRNLAIAIPGADVQLIDQLGRHCQDARHRGRPRHDLRP